MVEPIEQHVRALAATLTTPDVEVVDCDPELADTAAFCAAYGYAPEDSANAMLELPSVEVIEGLASVR